MIGIHPNLENKATHKNHITIIPRTHQVALTRLRQRMRLESAFPFVRQSFQRRRGGYSGWRTLWDRRASRAILIRRSSAVTFACDPYGFAVLGFRNTITIN